MELTAAVFVLLALTVVVGLYVARPFIQPRSVPSADLRSQEEHEEHVRSNLLAERDRVLEALHELDFDNALDKIPPDDYPLQRATLLQTGADILRQLDEIEVRAGGKRQAGSTEERIERAVAAHRADSTRARQGAGSNGGGKDELEELIASRKRERTESAGGFCPGCGRPVQKSDKFCSRCGTTL